MSETQTGVLAMVATLRDSQSQGGRLGFRHGCFMAHSAGVAWKDIASFLGTTPAALRRRLDVILEECR
jgi:hypothetical protein